MEYKYEYSQKQSDIQPYQTSFHVYETVYCPVQNRFKGHDLHFFQSKEKAKRFSHLAGKYVSKTKEPYFELKDKQRDMKLRIINDLVIQNEKFTDELFQMKLALLTLEQ